MRTLRSILFVSAMSASSAMAQPATPDLTPYLRFEGEIKPPPILRYEKGDFDSLFTQYGADSAIKNYSFNVPGPVGEIAREGVLDVRDDGVIVGNTKYFIRQLEPKVKGKKMSPRIWLLGSTPK